MATTLSKVISKVQNGLVHNPVEASRDIMTHLINNNKMTNTDLKTKYQNQTPLRWIDYKAMANEANSQLSLKININQAIHPLLIDMMNQIDKVLP